MVLYKIVFDLLLGQAPLSEQLVRSLLIALVATHLNVQKQECLKLLLDDFEAQCDLKGDSCPEVLALLSLGFGKLVLHSLVDDPKVHSSFLYSTWLILFSWS